jgi:hypothetical protein
MKLKYDNPFATPDAAERNLLELADAIAADDDGRISVIILTTQFRNAGGTSAEYRTAVTAAIAHGWLTEHQSGGYLSFTPLGSALFM